MARPDITSTATHCGSADSLLGVSTPPTGLAAAVLAISRSKLYELLAAGAVRSVRIDGSRRVPVAALEMYVAGLLETEVHVDAAAS